MVDLIYPLAFGVVLTIGSASIVRKTGYSGWWVLLAFVPLINFIVFLVFAFGRWPIEQELARYRVANGEGNEADFDAILNQAVSSEKYGDWNRALDLFELLAEKSRDKEIISYAEDSVASLQSKLAGPQ